MTDRITGTDARRALNGNDDASQHRDDLLMLEFLRLVETLGLDRMGLIVEFVQIVGALGVERAERLIANMRATLDLGPGTINDPRR